MVSVMVRARFRAKVRVRVRDMTFGVAFSPSFKMPRIASIVVGYG